MRNDVADPWRSSKWVCLSKNRSWMPWPRLLAMPWAELTRGTVDRRCIHAVTERLLPRLKTELIESALVGQKAQPRRTVFEFCTSDRTTLLAPLARRPRVQTASPPLRGRLTPGSARAGNRANPRREHRHRPLPHGAPHARMSVIVRVLGANAPTTVSDLIDPADL